MKHTNLNWQGSDGQEIFGRVWEPELKSDVEAVIILVHGMGEHSGRYQHFADFFSERNVAIISFDLRGHGKSPGKRGHVDSFDVLLSQVDKGLEESSRRFPGEKKFIYGHSMGGNIVINHALTRNPRVSGVIASAPYLRLPNPVPSSKMLQAKLMNRIWGSYAESNQIDVTQLSRDKAVVAAYEKDDMVHPKISVRFFIDSFNAAQYSLDHADQLDIPMLIMHGTADTITSHLASQEFAAKAPNYVSYKSWKGLYHEIHNEPEQNEVMQYAFDWMVDRMGTVG